jgi:hypothetical protein
MFRALLAHPQDARADWIKEERQTDLNFTFIYTKVMIITIQNCIVMMCTLRQYESKTDQIIFPISNPDTGSVPRGKY